MKTVYIVRHGKAVPAHANIADADRLLTDTGVARTCKIAEYMTESKPVIDQIIASPAERAFATALIIADKLGIKANKVISNEKRDSSRRLPACSFSRFIKRIQHSDTVYRKD